MCPSSVAEHEHQAGKETATCMICGTNFPRYNVTLSDLLPEIGGGNKSNSGHNASSASPRRAGWVSWSDLPREQSNGASCPWAPSESKLSVVSAGSCGTKLHPEEAGAPSDMHIRFPGSSVDGTRARSVVCERLAVSAGFGGARILTNFSESSGRGTDVLHAACDTRASCALRHVSA